MEALIRLGNLFKSRRKEKKLSLKAMKAQCGLSDSSFSKLERGEMKELGIIKAFEIGKKLDISPTEICHALGYADEVKLKRISCLNEDDISAVQTFIDFLIFRHNDSVGGDPK